MNFTLEEQMFLGKDHFYFVCFEVVNEISPTKSDNFD